MNTNMRPCKLGISAPPCRCALDAIQKQVRVLCDHRLHVEGVRILVKLLDDLHEDELEKLLQDEGRDVLADFSGLLPQLDDHRTQ